MNTQLLDFIVSTVGLLLTGGLWYGLWRPLADAHFEQDLFDARDVLFDLAAKGNGPIKFTSPVYRGTRRDLNSMIRSGSKVSLFAALTWALFIPSARRSQTARSLMLRQSMTVEERDVIKRIDRKQQMALLQLLISTSALMWVLIMLVGIFVPALIAIGTLKNGVKAVWTNGVSTVIKIFKTLLFVPAVEAVESQLGQQYLSGCC